MSRNTDNLITNERSKIRIANGSYITTEGVGRESISTIVNGSIERVTLREVLKSKELDRNLLSVSKLTDAGANVLFERDTAQVVRDGEVVLEAKK